MATTLQTLVQRARRTLRDWKDYDVLTGSLSLSSTSLTVSDTTIYGKRWPLEVDSEALIIRSIDTATQLQVMRGAYGSTASPHNSGSSVLIRPGFYTVEIIDALAEAMLAIFPAVYKPVVDTSTTVATNTYVYPIPTMPGFSSYPMPFVYRVEVLQPGDFTYRATRRFQIIRGASTSTSVTSTGISTSPAIKFKSLPPVSSTVRISGFGPHAPLANLSDTLDPLFPPQAEYLLPLYAAGHLLMSGEAARVRVSTGAVDEREQATRVGASAQIGQLLLARFQRELTVGAASSAMPPLPRHARPTI